MRLSEIITLETIKVPLQAKDKYSAIEELVDLLCDTGKISEKSKLLQAVLVRESVRSTGIGQGLAVPHGKAEGLGNLVAAVGKPINPMEFESIDGVPVNLIVLLGSNIDQTGPHIQALAWISRLMMRPLFRKQMDQAKTTLEVWQTFLKHEH
jgi:mannitol/fructose-specific phosphotransferase system IIA component (Ntr-type)